MRYLFRFGPILGAVVLAVAGCGKKAEIKSEISDLEKSFGSAGAAVNAQTGAGSAAQTQPTEAEAWVNRAVIAARTNDYVGSVIALQSARTARGVTPEQLMAVQRTMSAMTSDLAARAARGDAQAKADLAAIERTRSQ